MDGNEDWFETLSQPPFPQRMFPLLPTNASAPYSLQILVIPGGLRLTEPQFCREIARRIATVVDGDRDLINSRLEAQSNLRKLAVSVGKKP